jgi:hypothetical protein
MCTNMYFHSLLIEMQNCAANLEDSWQVFYRTKTTLTIQPRNAILGICPSEMKTYIHIKISM